MASPATEMRPPVETIEVPTAVDVLEIQRPLASAPTRFETALTLLEFLADLMSVFVGLQIVFWGWRVVNGPLRYDATELVIATLAISVVFVLMLDREGAYRPGNGLLRVKETERVLRVSAEVFLPFILIASILAPVPVSIAIIAALVVPAILIVQQQAIYVGVRMLHSKGIGVSKVLIYGAGSTGRRVFSALTRSPKLGLDPVIMVDDNPCNIGERVFELAYRRERSLSIEPGPITKELLTEIGIGMVVIAIPTLARDRFVEVFNVATAAGADVSFVPIHHVPFDFPVEHVDIDGLLLARLRASENRHFYSTLKRAADIVLGLLMSLIVAPVCAVVAAIVKIDSKGPVIFKQMRIGKDGEPFELYKFRTMYTDAPRYDFSPEASADPRITPVGRFLRRTSLDELPQLINILRGEMSLVGPRPEMPFIVDTYLPCHRQRLQVKPGLTGLWQISADRALQIHENIEYDLYYLRNRNFFMDLAILLHTLIFFMRGI